MEFTAVGLLCFALCALVMARPLSWGFLIFGAFLPLQTAAAINLPAFGGLSILCSYVLVGALCGAILLRPAMSKDLVRFGLQSPDVWLLAFFVIYAVASALFLPRFFAGEVSVYSFQRLESGITPLVTLHPSSGNISQSVYAIGNFALYFVLTYLLVIGGSFKRGMQLLNTVTIVHLVFTLLHALPANALSNAVFDFIHTANYVIHSDQHLAGTRRFIGSYTEPASFGSATVLLFAFNLIRYLQTRGIWYGLAAFALLLSVLGSLSTTAYAALVLLVAARSLQSVFGLMQSGLKREDLILLLANALAIGVAILFLFNEPARAYASQLYELLFGNKLESQSGIVRGRWNAQAWSNMIDTFGLGVGLGSGKSSGVAGAFLGNVGVLGTLLFCSFLYITVVRPAAYRRIAISGVERVLSIRLYSAARAGALGGLVAALIAGTSPNLPLQFYVMAALAGAALRPHRRQLLAQSAKAAPMATRLGATPLRRPSLKLQNS